MLRIKDIPYTAKNLPTKTNKKTKIIKDKQKWKEIALDEIFNKYKNEVENIICASDSIKDINVFKEFMEKHKEINVSTIKFKRKPNPSIMIKEIKYLIEYIDKIIGTNKNYYLMKEDKEKNIKFITEKIDNSKNKKELLRKKTKNARKSNNTKNVRKDNGFQTLCTACEDKINESIQTEIDNYLMEKNIKIDSKLYKPAITPLPCSIAKKVIFIEKPILKYYLNYTKQRLNEERAGLSNKYKNTKIIRLLLHLEKEDAKREEKKFKMIFNTPFKDYLLAFVKDEQFMIKESQISLKFETLKDCFNNGKIRYNAKDKDNLKNYTIKLFNRNMKRKK